MRHFVANLLRWTRPLYITLATVWALIVAWQMVEHRRVRQSARAALINRSQDITTTLGLVIKSQRRFGGIVSQERLESALTELVKSGELNSVALLNAAGEVVASAGPRIGFDPQKVMHANERWGGNSVTLVNLVDLGASVTDRREPDRPTIVLPRRDPSAEPRDGERDRERGSRTNSQAASNPPGVAGTNGANLANANPTNASSSSINSSQANPPSTGPGQAPGRWDRADRPEPPPGPPREPRDRWAGGPGERPPGAGPGPGGSPGERAGERDPADRGPGGPRFGRPPFRMDEQEYKSLLERRGLHGLVIAMSTDAVRRACTQDVWMRALMACFASVSVLGLGLAWRNLVKSSELQMRLLRASELTTHLKEMNLAAAGLAHETRNPLNIIRGVAQMIGKQQDASPEIRRKTRDIIDETDRVTAQLNEFINYSRPREVRRAPVPLSTVIGEVSRALTHDLEENCIRLQTQEDLPVIDADEQLLRQALFNLLINAVQAVGRGGNIEVAAWKNHASGAVLEIRDNGPGVAPEHRAEIFKPYFTTHQKGTGLGLAVVEQIVLAHGWEIECVPNQPRGAIFRISHLRSAAVKG